METRKNKYKFKRGYILILNKLYSFFKIVLIVATLFSIVLFSLYKIGETSIHNKNILSISQDIKENALDIVFKEDEDTPNDLKFSDINNIENITLDDFYENQEIYFLFIYSSNDDISLDFYKTLDTAIKEADVAIKGIDLSLEKEKDVSKFVKKYNLDIENPYLLKVLGNTILNKTQNVRYDELTNWLNNLKFNR